MRDGMLELRNIRQSRIDTQLDQIAPGAQQQCAC
jgi:hypothetical protein